MLGVGAGLWCPPKLIGLAGPPPSSNNCRILIQIFENLLDSRGFKRVMTEIYLLTEGDRIDDGPPMCCEDKDRTGSADKAR